MGRELLPRDTAPCIVCGWLRGFHDNTEYCANCGTEDPKGQTYVLGEMFGDTMAFGDERFCDLGCLKEWLEAWGY